MYLRKHSLAIIILVAMTFCGGASAKDLEADFIVGDWIICHTDRQIHQGFSIRPQGFGIGTDPTNEFAVTFFDLHRRNPGTCTATISGGTLNCRLVDAPGGPLLHPIEIRQAEPADNGIDCCPKLNKCVHYDVAVPERKISEEETGSGIATSGGN